MPPPPERAPGERQRRRFVDGLMDPMTALGLFVVLVALFVVSRSPWVGIVVVALQAVLAGVVIARAWRRRRR